MIINILMLICNTCAHKITSVYHSTHCTTIGMWQLIENTPEQLKEKPMMTYGLNGCTACIVCMYDGDNLVKVVFTHNPSQYMIFNKISKIITNTHYQFKIIIKTPGEYKLKDDGYYDVFPSDTTTFSILEGMENIKIIYCPYITDTMSDFNSTIYLNYDGNNIVYSNNYGCYIPL